MNDRPLSELIAECGLAESCPLTALWQSSVTTSPVTHHVTKPLTREGVHTLGEVAKRSDEALLKIDQFGPGRLDKLKAAVIGATPSQSDVEETSHA